MRQNGRGWWSFEKDGARALRAHRWSRPAAKVLLHILTSRRATWPDFVLLAACERFMERVVRALTR